MTDRHRRPRIGIDRDDGDPVSPLIAAANEAMRRGAMTEAATSCRRALARDPGHPRALSALGMVMLSAGRWTEAVGLLSRAIHRAPGSASLRCDLAFACRLAGSPEAAIRHARDSLRLDSAQVTARTVLGMALLDLGRADEAIEPLQQALRSSPKHGKVKLALADAYRAAGRHGDARGHYDDLVTSEPDPGEARARLGWLDVEELRYDDAERNFRSALAAHRASRWWPGDGFPGVPPAAATPVNAFKLDHDIEQFGYLLDKGLLPTGFASTVDDYRRVKAMIERNHGAANVLLSPAELGPIGSVFARVVHFRHTARRPDSALGEGWDRRETERRYKEQRDICWIDGLLAPGPLDELRRFCLESTIWNDLSHNFRRGSVARAYLGAYAADGLCCPLLFQIADELSRSMPALFRGHRLMQMWAYKYGAGSEGIDIHGDDAAVNVNFWITPDEANLDADSGGLIVYPVKAPGDWNFAAINRHPEQIWNFLKSSAVAPIDVPYRQNRAVIFDSDLFHTTAPMRFKPGYENRRINVTMLFGRRVGGSRSSAC